MLQVDIDKITPVTEARDNLNKIVDEVDNSDIMHVLTRNGTPAAVIVGVNHLEKLTGHALDDTSTGSTPVTSATTDDDKDDKKEEVKSPTDDDKPELEKKPEKTDIPKSSPMVVPEKNEESPEELKTPETAEPTKSDVPSATTTPGALPSTPEEPEKEEATPPVTTANDDLFSDFDDTPETPAKASSDGNTKSIFDDDAEEPVADSHITPVDPAANKPQPTEQNLPQVNEPVTPDLPPAPVPAPEDNSIPTTTDNFPAPSTEVPPAETPAPTADQPLASNDSAPAESGMSYNEFIAPATGNGVTDSNASTETAVEQLQTPPPTTPLQVPDTDDTVDANTTATATPTADPVHPNYAFDQNPPSASQPQPQADGPLAQASTQTPPANPAP